MTVGYALDGRTMPSADASIDYRNACKELMQFYVELNIYIFYYFFFVLYHVVISVLIMCALDSQVKLIWIEHGKEYRMKN